MSQLAFLLVLAIPSVFDPAEPLPRAHAHNDHRHDRPLLDALDHGFCSVEADIFLIGNQLLVAHDPTELRPNRTLERLYLEPLRERVEKNAGRVHPNGPRFMLLIDIKYDGAKTYARLDEVLSEYSGMLTRVVNGVRSEGAVEVVVSGDRPKDQIAADQTRYVGIDGRLAVLQSTASADLMPLISDRWGSHFRWRGKGPIPDAERVKLREIVRKAHQAGRRVRFWATPESTELWKELVSAGVDHLNTDRLGELEVFLRGHD
ncbi:MAG: phosphatidylinositol-specific phospholipase C/glycerophosphodiester phosphodiesterase family protein [Planctomycetota bacterium]